MTPHLNAYQGQQLVDALVVWRQQSDELDALGWSPAGPIGRMRIEPFPCRVDGMACAMTHDGVTIALLYPEPRPVPGDPMFQHAEAGLERSTRRALTMLHMQPGMRRDWNAHEALDAPDVMPAGACCYFCAAEDAYGAEVMTWRRGES